MIPCVVRRSSRLRLLSALAALSLLAACEDKRVEQLQAGITRDSVMSITAQNTTTTADAAPSIYTSANYLIDGKTLEVLYFDSKNRKHATDSTVKLRSLTPLVMYDGRLVGKGWAVWDSAANANKIPLVK